jgi:AcrR family transcriptional regulator
MARLRSPEKRSAILQAATYEIAENGLGASTASIAHRAGIAAGSLFTYFATKDELLNELYAELKSEAYERINHSFPRNANLEKRALHLWTNYLDWAIEFPEKRKVSAQLNVSNLITAQTRARSLIQRGAVDFTLKELESRDSLRSLPNGFVAAAMVAFQDATIEFIIRYPRRRKELIDRSFELFWRAFE